MGNQETATDGLLFLQVLAGLGNTRESWDAQYERLHHHPLIMELQPEAAISPREKFKEQLARDKRKENGNLVKYYEKKLKNAFNNPDVVTLTDNYSATMEGRDLLAEAFGALAKLVKEPLDPALLPHESEFLGAVRQAHLNNLAQGVYRNKIHTPRKSFEDVVMNELRTGITRE